MLWSDAICKAGKARNLLLAISYKLIPLAVGTDHICQFALVGRPQVLVPVRRICMRLVQVSDLAILHPLRYAMLSPNHIFING